MSCIFLNLQKFHHLNHNKELYRRFKSKSSMKEVKFSRIFLLPWLTYWRRFIICLGVYSFNKGINKIISCWRREFLKLMTTVLILNLIELPFVLESIFRKNFQVNNMPLCMFRQYVGQEEVLDVSSFPLWLENAWSLTALVHDLRSCIFLQRKI